MNQKQIDALRDGLVRLVEDIYYHVQRKRLEALRAAFAEPMPLPTPEDVRGILAEPEPPKAEEPVPCVECGEEPKIDLGVEGFYINCKGCCNTPDCLTRKGAIRVWNAMQEAARRER